MGKYDIDQFRVSVIIPVYNAAKFVTKSVESAVHLKEVGEILLIEDNSPDNALEICLQLQKMYDKVRLFRHPNGENRGAGASRNLGISYAQYDYIAFLDADDWYLPNRFDYARSVYSLDKFDVLMEKSITDSSKYIYQLKDESTFSALLRMGRGTIATNAITIKRSILKPPFLFNEDLRLNQDTDLWLKLSLYCNVITNFNSDPVSVVRIHANNRITKSKFEDKYKFRHNLLRLYVFNRHVSFSNQLYIIKRFTVIALAINKYRITKLFA
ncbi:glycosyltransferase family 2 protein [Pontibacter ramchanderi]|uniref:Glycosyltransferase involved in cell wall biosynthesis n=1 Tax=Pontibacter ramchanderi TaxID=1179743 RepID=A0A2N3U903_9BACT|nr:glycosyltransferase family 2 protein [Pontibacter ramchanderi]PKV63222.1 glycosyltransferase involved in cell wall biosynthesis [Pontibacter ramchanderi]